ncbi:uncharacterized protein LOC129571730 [Sitodiplosis mosellana]|uniref:uncharacterized protein LOC129571730 n=1 Tax=Sitodiplosis mosellana TaxID=263140 RepID=UPI0024446F5A|nr:uncharacterized protein LOC129571730 [Sitodiplosis mosellana]
MESINQSIAEMCEALTGAVDTLGSVDNQQNALTNTLLVLHSQIIAGLKQANHLIGQTVANEAANANGSVPIVEANANVEVAPGDIVADQILANEAANSLENVPDRSVNAVVAGDSGAEMKEVTLIPNIPQQRLVGIVEGFVEVVLNIQDGDAPVDVPLIPLISRKRKAVKSSSDWWLTKRQKF